VSGKWTTEQIRRGSETPAVVTNTQRSKQDTRTHPQFLLSTAVLNLQEQRSKSVRSCHSSLQVTLFVAQGRQKSWYIVLTAFLHNFIHSQHAHHTFKNIKTLCKTSVSLLQIVSLVEALQHLSTNASDSRYE